MATVAGLARIVFFRTRKKLCDIELCKARGWSGFPHPASGLGVCGLILNAFRYVFFDKLNEMDRWHCMNSFDGDVAIKIIDSLFFLMTSDDVI